MRAYRVQDGEGKMIRFGGSQTEAKQKRDEIIETLGVKKKEVSIEEIEIPTSKTELLEFLNEFSSESDDAEADE